MKVLSMAAPMILSNITIPLLGLVDATVIGHLEHASYLGGVAVGGMMINVILWLFGFLRMSTTGTSAQAYGASDSKKLAQLLLQGAILSIIFSGFILILSHPLSHLILSFSDASPPIKESAEHYFLIRINSCPAALMNLVFMGWLLGNHQAKNVMKLVMFINAINIVLDIIFVPGLKMGIKGAAIASVIADYAGFILGLYFIVSTWLQRKLPSIRLQFGDAFEDIASLLKLNLDIFARNLFLQAVFSFMTFKGATFGDTIAASNAILMNFLLFVSYLMDGFAYTMEAFVGSSFGAKNKRQLHHLLRITAIWSLITSLICTTIFAFFGTPMIDFMSSINEVCVTAKTYLPWLIGFPLISMWSFLLDGIFVGTTRGKDMRNGMLISTAIYFLSYAMLHNYDNHALWASMLIFMAARWVVLGTMLKLKPIRV